MIEQSQHHIQKEGLEKFLDDLKSMPEYHSEIQLTREELEADLRETEERIKNKIIELTQLQGSIVVVRSLEGRG